MHLRASQIFHRYPSNPTAQEGVNIDREVVQQGQDIFVPEAAACSRQRGVILGPCPSLCWQDTFR